MKERESVFGTMPRRIRFIPADSLVEVTCRTVQGRFLLRPTPIIADLILGVLARAARLYPVQIHAFCFLSNHLHLLMTVESAYRLAAFMRYLNSNLAREIGRAVDWRDRFWGRRYQAVLVDPDPASQLARFVYILRQGTKENLVASPLDWPGPSSLASLLTGETITGTWLDRTLAHRARRAGTPLTREEISTIETLTLVPLPCWRKVDEPTRRDRVVQLVRAIEEETAQRIRTSGISPLGRARLERQEPHARSNRLERSPAPLIHTTSADTRRAYRSAYRNFLEAFRSAAAAVGRGARDALFPVGSFPPAPPFVTIP
jgi:REP element-mobilizing transposase RayT